MLKVRNLSVSYGRNRAVKDVSFDVGEGQIISIIGANGAGKSTILNAICGITRPRAGEVRFRGEDISAFPSHTIFERGVVQVPEGRMIFGTLSVEENLAVAERSRSRFFLKANRRRNVADMFPALADRLDLPASSLSGGEAQMLALARGLESRPRLLLLDEPSLGLSPKASEQVFALIRKLRSDGLSILLVEQNVHQTLALSDRGYVLEGGRFVLEGTPETLMESDLLVSNYLGVSAHSGSPQL